MKDCKALVKELKNLKKMFAPTKGPSDFVKQMPVVIDALIEYLQRKE